MYEAMRENVLPVKNRIEFRQWLTLHASKETECWITVKRGKPIDPDVFYYLDAVEEALCFGWIDSTHAVIDGVRMQRFSPRKKNSPWTELNKERVCRLEKLGLMTDAGRAVLPAMGARSFKVDPDIGNTAFYKKRNPAMYEQMLSRLIAETKKGQMFGEWNDYGRLADY